MAFAKPEFSKGQVNKAGEILVSQEPFDIEKFLWASNVLANWRACHLYPINTFQALLRLKLKQSTPKHWLPNALSVRHQYC